MASLSVAKRQVKCDIVVIASFRLEFLKFRILENLNVTDVFVFTDFEPYPGALSFRLSNTPGFLCPPIKASLEVMNINFPQFNFLPTSAAS